MSEGKAALPAASSSRVYKNPLVEDERECHGCGKQFEILRQCSKCKRVYYCSRDCQRLDWKKHSHKHSCHPNFLAVVMNNLPELGMEEKMMLRTSGGYVPNQNVNQTIGRVLPPSFDILLAEAVEELGKIREICEMPIEEVASIDGNAEGNAYLSHPRAGFDLGVKTLSLVINYLPGVYTVDSCSGFHRDSSLDDGVNPNPIVAYASDDITQLNVIKYIAEKGGLGINFAVGPTHSHCDGVGSLQGIVSLDMPSGHPGKYSTVRTYGREIRLPAEPFDTLDQAYLKAGDAMGRNRHYLIGYFGLALEIFEVIALANRLDGAACKKWQELKDSAMELRSELIARGNEKYGLSS